MNTTLRSIVVIVSLVTTGMTMALSPSITNAANAKQFMKGGEYCFRIGTPIPGGWTKALKMIVSHASGGATFRIAHVDALERGIQATNPPRTYVTPLTGSATIASQLTSDKQIQISLGGSNFGSDVIDGVTGIWIESHALTLNQTDLTGHDTGYETFTPVQAGQLGEPNKYAVNETITPISCNDF